MAVAHRATTTAGDSSGTTLTVGRPAGTAPDDILRLHFYAESLSLTPSISPGTWTLIQSDEQTSGVFNYETFVYWARVGSDTGDFTVSWGGADVWRIGLCSAYSGVELSGDPQDATASVNESASPDRSLIATGITTVTDNSMLVAGGANEVGATHTWSGVTERADFGGQSIADAIQATAGASGNKTASLVGGGATPSWAAYLIALKESPAPFVVAAGTASFTATNGATLSPGLPTGWAADDIHVLIAARSDNTAMTSLATDWVNISAANNTAAQRVEVWVRRAVGGDAAPTVTFGSGTVVRGARIIGVRGVDPALDLSTLEFSRSDNAASATITFATLTPTPANTRLLALYAYEDDPSAASQIAAWSPFAVSTSSLGADMALGYADKGWGAASTATGGLTSTASGGTFANSVNVGILLALPPASDAGEERTVAGSQPAATGVLARILAALRSVAGAQPSGTATLTRALAAPRALAGAQPAATGTLTRSAASPRSVDGAQPAATGALAYLRGYARPLAGSQPTATGALSSVLAALRAVAGAQPAGSATLGRQAALSATVVGSQPAPSGTLARILGAIRSLAGSQPAPSATLSAQAVVSRTVDGSQPTATGSLSRIYGAVRATSGAQDAPTGTLARSAGAFARALAGAQPSATGTLARILAALRALAGSQPGGSGTLGAAQGAQSRSVAGSQPAATGTLTRVYAAVRALAGVQPAPTGGLARLLTAVRTLAGSQPTATGTLTRSKANARTLAGAQPAPAGALENLFTTTRLLAGSQPAAVGSLTRAAVLSRALAGAQPAPSGLLGRLAAYGRALAGSQDAPSGVLAGTLAVILGLARALVSRTAPATATVTKVTPASASVTLAESASGVLERV